MKGLLAFGAAALVLATGGTAHLPRFEVLAHVDPGVRSRRLPGPARLAVVRLPPSVLARGDRRSRFDNALTDSVHGPKVAWVLGLSRRG